MTQRFSTAKNAGILQKIGSNIDLSWRGASPSRNMGLKISRHFSLKFQVLLRM
jgi:hypothetical protein